MDYVSPAASDLALYLGVATEEVSEDRAGLLITQAEALAKAIIAILPAAATAVILSAAGRAYVNPVSTASQAAGPYSMSGVAGGVYLTKAERATLRRLAGGSGAFSIDMLGSGYPDDRFPTVC